ncbi:Rft protein-domain-containing protein [Kalaharituber pfeilii]|nr:Rft protein-domain-containing protein [Kalaharituber pfeilii]
MSTPSDSYRNGANDSLLHASAEGVKFLVLLQIASRLLTFIVNQILLRYLSPELLGISVQFELYMITILYFSRESLRTALQRYGINKQAQSADNSSSGPLELTEGSSAAQAQTVVNLAYISIPLGLLFAAILAPYYVSSFVSTDTASQPYFYHSVILYTLATLLELLSEPGFAIAQQMLLYRLRARAESAAALVRCFLTCGLTIYVAKIGLGGARDAGPLPFAMGQLGYAIVLVVIYMRQCWHIAAQDSFKVGLAKIKSSSNNYYQSYFHKQLVGLAFSMWMQAAIKHVLTQGDSLLIAWLATTHDQGVYALGSNYGSLIARMLFQPLEESSRNLFAKLLSQPEKKDGQTTKIDSVSLHSVILILQNILRLYSIMSVFFFSLGPPLAPVLLRIVAGSRWSNSAAGTVLSTFCYYIPLLAVNGITEAFVQSTATSRQLHKQSLWMFAFSMGFGLAGYVFLKELSWGAQGLVWANAVNMGLRILWSWYFIHSYFREAGVEGVSVTSVMPNWILVGIAAIAGTALRSLQGLQTLNLSVLAKAGSLSLLLLGVCAITERKFFLECYRLVKSGKGAIDDPTSQGVKQIHRQRGQRRGEPVRKLPVENEPENS